MNKQYKDHVGQRLLIEWGIGSILEVRVMEVSPSGARVKIKRGIIEEWIPAWKHDILEVLP